jgi:hypothetical protein
MGWTDGATHKIERANWDGTGVKDRLTTYASGPIGGGGALRYRTGDDKMNFANGLTRRTDEIILSAQDCRRKRYRAWAFAFQPVREVNEVS